MTILSGKEQEEYLKTYSSVEDALDILIMDLLKMRHIYNLKTLESGRYVSTTGCLEVDLSKDFETVNRRYKYLRDQLSELTAIIAGDMEEYFELENNGIGCGITYGDLNSHKLLNTKQEIVNVFGTTKTVVLTIEDTEEEDPEDDN